MEPIIRQARVDENEILTVISFAAKRHWNYPESYYKIWEKELIITREYITQNIVYNLIIKDEVVGFYSFLENLHDFRSGDTFIEKGLWMEHLFILPSKHRIGLGSILLQHAKEVAESKVVDRFKVFVDPYARGFYEKLGAIWLRDSLSSIPGRIIPVFEIKIKTRFANPAL